MSISVHQSRSSNVHVCARLYRGTAVGNTVSHTRGMLVRIQLTANVHAAITVNQGILFIENGFSTNIQTVTCGNRACTQHTITIAVAGLIVDFVSFYGQVGAIDPRFLTFIVQLGGVYGGIGTVN